MLGKMLVHAVVAAALIASAAAVYAQTKDEAPAIPPAAKVEAPADGYIRPAVPADGKSDRRDRDERRDKHHDRDRHDRDRHEREHDRDHDDD